MNKEKQIWTKDFIIITLLNFLLYASFQLFPSALPPYLRSLGANESTLGWVSGITTISTLLIRPIAGKVLDKWDRKGIYVLGLIILILASISYTFIPIVSVILIIRFIHGIGWALSSTATNTIATSTIKKDVFGESMSYFSLSVAIAMALAPTISLYFSLENIVIIAVLLLILSLIIIYFQDFPKPEPSTKEKGSVYEKNAIMPAILIFLNTATYGGIVTFLALFASNRGIENPGLFFTIYSISTLISRPFLGKLLDKKGLHFNLSLSFLLMIPSMFLLSQAHSLGTMLVAAVFYGVGYGAIKTCLQTMSVIHTPSHRQGAANATYYTGFDGGIGFGAVLSGMIVSKFGYDALFIILAIMPVFSFLLYLAYHYKRKAK